MFITARYTDFKAAWAIFFDASMDRTASLRSYLPIMMDKHLMNHPTEGVRSMVFFLRYLGYNVNHKRVRRLFRLMGRETIYRRKNLTKAGLREFIKPYLLRDLKIERPNQAWCTDITYIPMAKGFMYLTAVMEVYSRKILSWGISNSLEAAWCKQVLKEAVERYGKPDIINSDQGCQYTSALWTEYVHSLDHTRISMDGKGRATDNRDRLLYPVLQLKNASHLQTVPE